MIHYLLLERVSIGSWEHLIPILIGIVISVFSISFSKRKLSLEQQQNFFKIFGWFVSLFVIAFHLYFIFFDSYDIQKDLPLYLCSFIAVLIPIFTNYRNYLIYEILVFWIIAGTLQGVITPDIEEGFPTFDYFRYWIVHLGLLIIIFYATFVFGMTPKLKSVFKSFLALQVYLILMICINWLLDSNYFYLNEKPKSASLLDYFGEWPIYILIVQLLLLPYFLVIYVPFYLSEKRMKLFRK
ncbi:TIGR02206 family membrane protein [Subsaxibacter sp. CAU 1640]|uniref:YwaF family protein n=1 Tax=Subsaxibacter sp. CAU 1640 TaxID=2933271 RepID=UPI002003BF5A|nr:TIGR02206 family membrane protein [Subsaxibacter sp. CAU 1640]MCK7592013.1 TIGR02206 family membrane protein [Subsaxibacter sp. CAU 1640]